MKKNKIDTAELKNRLNIKSDSEILEMGAVKCVGKITGIDKFVSFVSGRIYPFIIFKDPDGQRLFIVYRFYLRCSDLDNEMFTFFEYSKKEAVYSIQCKEYDNRFTRMKSFKTDG